MMLEHDFITITACKVIEHSLVDVVCSHLQGLTIKESNYYR